MSQGQAAGRYEQLYQISNSVVEPIKKWLWLVPIGLIYTPFMLVPIAILFGMSLFRDVRSDPTFVGFDNYTRLLTDGTFYDVLQNTFVYTIGNTVLTVGGGLLLALALKGAYRWVRAVFQIVFLLPYAIMSVGVAIIWTLMYNPRRGALPSLFERLGMDVQIQFLGDPTYVMPSIIAAGVWWTIGFYTIIWLVGLTSIDERYYEAARTDGANRLQMFRYITLPLLKPIGLFLLIISVITSLRIFGLVWVMTRGGPAGASDVIVTWMYRIAFVNNNLGLAAALGVVLFVITLAISLINIKVIGLESDSV